MNKRHWISIDFNSSIPIDIEENIIRHAYLYAIKTQGQHLKEFSDWLDSLQKEKPIKYEMENWNVTESFRRKKRKYWRDTVGRDSAIDWTWNLRILKKKLEFNIGYWRYVQRYVGWQEDVNRMKIAINLMEIAKTD